MNEFLSGIRRVFAYARVSTKHQSGLSIDGQFRMCERFAEFYNMTIVGKFSDKETGKVNTREQFDVMLERVYAGEVDGILCEKYDRFSRAGASGEVLIQKIEKETGIRVIAVAELMDTTTPVGRAMRGMRMLFAALEREETVDRTIRRMKDMARYAYWMGGQPPLGYKVIDVQDKEGKLRKKLAIDEETAPLVRKIFELYADGKSQAQIVDWLNAQGYKTSRGGAFTKQSLHDILHNEKYRGIYTYFKGTKHNHHAKRDDVVRVPGGVPAIIDEELWDQVQKRFRAHAGYKHRYLLAGLLKCGRCGGYMHGHGGKEPDYRCIKHKPRLTIRKSKIEDFVLAYIKYEILEAVTDIDFELMAHEINAQATQRDHTRKQMIDKLTLELSRLQTDEERLIQAIKAGIGLEGLKEEAQKIKQRKEEIKLKLSQLRGPGGNDYIKVQELKENWELMKKRFYEGTSEQKEMVVRQLIDEVILHPSGYIQVIQK
ncbi:recombinase family protein [Kosmotoga pacifica]|uniref:Resolvase n=1 Tax=Kosmotoga pacifica TaxID=1330330 RepID=A0A0G2ZCS6_9BACT|nr:recombinase family protein [Kosmotoga pacifica]AKI96553.1 hypothetical protein IX53_00525 [Kosmotoga pacifica]